MCKYAGNYSAAMMTVTLLCDLEVKGRLTKENLVLTWDEWNKIMNEYDVAVETALKSFPDCSIKP